MSKLHRLVRFALPLLALPLLVATVAPQQEGGAVQAPMIHAPDDPLLAPYRFRNIGPASMGGRINDIEAAPSDPNVIYIGYAVGGVWKSENNGTTWLPVFDTYGVASIGDLAIHPTNPNIVYVGTGEANNRQTSSFGDGIYKTTDGGKTFQHIGLRETQTIAKILIDPKNPDTVYVAALGHLFGSNKERGIYKSTDGGRNWANVKFIDENTGFTDLAMDPSDTNILYAASYQRRRLGCCFNGGGPGSGLWKTTDAGKTWTKLTENGLPPGTYGRIALGVSHSNPNVVYAQIEAGEVGRPQTTPPVDPNAATEMTPTTPPGQPPAAAAQAGRGAAVAQPPGARGQRGAAPAQQAGGERGGGGGYNWCNNAGPGRGFGGGRGGDAPQGEQRPPALDPSRGGVFRSENKGASWTHVSNCNARPMYFSKLRVDPSDDNVVYVAGLPWAKSLDGGRTFATLDNAGGHGSPGHVDQHAMWINPRNPKHILIGNDGGFNVTWDQGRSWQFINTMPTALAYWVSADMRRPYYVYIGLQDNGSWGGPSAKRGRGGIMNSDWFRIGGGDGFQTAVDPTDHNIVYWESQNGNTNRYDLSTGQSRSIRPRGFATGRGGGGGGGRGGPATPNVLNASKGDEVYRFNWNTPFQISPHDPSIVWLGGNRLFKSYDRGDTWTASADLTRRVDRNTITIMGVPGDRSMLSKNDGVTSYSTIIAVNESPVVPGIVWVGTDDGNVQVSRDGGATFTEVGKNMQGLPPNHDYWISRISASHFDPAVAYVSVDGHRSNDLKPYVFVTRDYGQTWQNITNNLPPYGNVQVVREDPRNRDLLYAGTEFGLYISTTAGKEWTRFMPNLPTVRVDDVLVHPRDNDLIVATHGRSVWIADDITALQQLTPAVRNADAHLFDIRPVVDWLNDPQANQYVGGQQNYAGENAPRGAAIHFYLKGPGEVRLAISDLNGRQVRTLTAQGRAGVNRVMWNLQAAAPEGEGERGAGQGGERGAGGRGGGRGGGGGAAVDPGTYLVTMTAGNRTMTKALTVLEDRWMKER